MDRPTFFGKATTRLLLAITLVAIAIGLQRVALVGPWFVIAIVVFQVAFFWIIHVRDFTAERRWFDTGMAGERPRQRLGVRSTTFHLVLLVSVLGYFTWLGFRYDEW